MASVKINHTLFRHSLNPKELQCGLDHVAAAGLTASKLDAQLTSALKSGTGIEEASADILFSTQSILYSAIRANKKLRVPRRATLNRCLALPGTLKIGTHIIEPVNVYPREKKGGRVT